MTSIRAGMLLLNLTFIKFKHFPFQIKCHLYHFYIKTTDIYKASLFFSLNINNKTTGAPEKKGNKPNRCHSDLKLKLHTTTEKQHFAHHLGQNSSQLGVHVTTQKYHWHTFYSRNRTNRNATYSIPIRVHSALFKDNASKLSGEMRRDKRARHRYRIDKPCIGGTQLQELYCEQTV